MVRSPTALVFWTRQSPWLAFVGSKIVRKAGEGLPLDIVLGISAPWLTATFSPWWMDHPVTGLNR